MFRFGTLYIITFLLNSRCNAISPIFTSYQISVIPSVHLLDYKSAKKFFPKEMYQYIHNSRVLHILCCNQNLDKVNWWPSNFFYKETHELLIFETPFWLIINNVFMSEFHLAV